MAMFLTKEDYLDTSMHTPTGSKRMARRQANEKRRKVEMSGNYWFLSANDDEDFNDGELDPVEDVQDHELDEDSDTPLDESESDEYEWDSEYESDSQPEGLVLDEEGDDDVFESDEDESQLRGSLAPPRGEGPVCSVQLNSDKQLGPQDLKHVMATTPPIRGDRGYNWPWLD